MSVKHPPPSWSPRQLAAHEARLREARNDKAETPPQQHGQHKGAHFRSGVESGPKSRPPSPLPRRRPATPANTSSAAASAFANDAATPDPKQVDTESSKFDNKNYTDSDDGGRENQSRERLVGTMRLVGRRDAPQPAPAAQPAQQAQGHAVQRLDRSEHATHGAPLAVFAQRLMHAADTSAALGASTQALMGEVRNIMASIGPKGLQADGLAAVRTALIDACKDRSAAAARTLRSINGLLPLMLLNLQRERSQEGLDLALGKLDVLTRRARKADG